MGLQTRTTAYSCGSKDEDYEENLLMSRPLPWVVRVYFKAESSMKGALCSATIIDRYWLATSKKCCLGKGSFDVKFDDENKSQWIFWGKKQHKGCVKKTKCSKMLPRADEERLKF